jgi:Flp pilus assembly protein protease CpaA
MLHTKKVPYGIAIGGAAFLAFPSSPLVQAMIGTI